MTVSPDHVHRPRRPRQRLRALPVTVAVFAMLTPAAALGATSTPSPSPSSTAAARPSSTLTVGTNQDVDSLNPFVGILATSYEIFQMTYDTLTNYSAKNFSPTPGLASSWKTSPDGLTWTYTIRSGVKWSDGVPLTAHDVAYSFNRVMHGSYEQTNYGNYVSNIASVTAPNDTTVVMKTKRPSPSMLALGVYIIPEHIWKHVSEKAVGTFKNTAMVGSGPFVMEERQTGQFVRLRANPNYWGGAPHISQVVFRIFNNEDAMVQALRKGEIDFADNLQSSLYKSLANAPNIKQVPAVYSGFDEIGMNTGAATASGQPIGNGNPALKNVAVRQAINWAINRQTLVSRVLDGYGQVGTTIIPPIYSTEHYQPTPGELYTYNPTKAGQILDAAGFKKDSNGIRVNPATGKEVSLRLFGRSDSQTSRQSVQFVQSWLQDIGFKVTVKILSEDNLDEIIGDGDYDLFEFGWVDEPDPDYQLSTMTCAQRSAKSGKSYIAGLSDSFYCNPAYDAVYNKQKSEISIPARMSTVKAAQKIVYDAGPYAVTFYYDDLEAYRADRFTDWVNQPTGTGALLFQWGVWSYLHVRPVVAATGSSSSSGGGSNATVWVLVAVVVVALVGGAFTFGRRRGTADDRE